MLDCWHSVCTLRPNFSDLVGRLGDLLQASVQQVLSLLLACMEPRLGISRMLAGSWAEVQECPESPGLTLLIQQSGASQRPVQCPRTPNLVHSPEAKEPSMRLFSRSNAPNYVTEIRNNQTMQEKLERFTLITVVGLEFEFIFSKPTAMINDGKDYIPLNGTGGAPTFMAMDPVQETISSNIIMEARKPLQGRWGVAEPKAGKALGGGFPGLGHQQGACTDRRQPPGGRLLRLVAGTLGAAKPKAGKALGGGFPGLGHQRGACTTTGGRLLRSLAGMLGVAEPKATARGQAPTLKEGRRQWLQQRPGSPVPAENWCRQPGTAESEGWELLAQGSHLKEHCRIWNTWRRGAPVLPECLGTLVDSLVLNYQLRHGLGWSTIPTAEAGRLLNCLVTAATACGGSSMPTAASARDRLAPPSCLCLWPPAIRHLGLQNQRLLNHVAEKWFPEPAGASTGSQPARGTAAPGVPPGVPGHHWQGTRSRAQQLDFKIYHAESYAEFKAAIEDLNAVLFQLPSWPEVYFRKVKVLHDAGFLGDALQLFLQCLAFDEDFAPAKLEVEKILFDLLSPENLKEG
ncbi:LOW QUALITY PROTEIN: hypothetical protein QTO34_000711 [Cnephaeus nilssonii]|uniref:Uncharacterized protein n=1 Tax=Cnephaeus nilssonii TaxID=3371016 RepID=A0AA40ICR9_CNENI|nr:LOW QUALITY PROTEIN: hypothetical protein QTO34_000711 [Eptesicus nilssonii]